MADFKHEDVDLTDVEIQQCPYDAYKKLRDNAPIYQDPKTGFFIVTRYEDVRHVLKDTENFKSSYGRPEKAEGNINSEHVKRAFNSLKKKVGFQPQLLQEEMIQIIKK